MDSTGLFKKFASGRVLTDAEKAHRLLQKKRLDTDPHYQLSVIEMNSTYLESVDKWYGFRGSITAVSLIIMLMVMGFYAALVHVSLNRSPTEVHADDAFVLIFVACLALPLLAFTSWMLFKDSFGYTHYPLRFNRRTRTVHVFRPDASVLSVPWDAVVFTLSMTAPVQNMWNIMGHVLDKDGVTVRESFALSVSETGAPEGLELLRSHWEFVRRYMEEGPEAVTGQVQFCLPIAKQRESFMFGLHRLMANSSTNAFYLWPIVIMSMAFDLLIVPFRFFAMRTSKIPVWTPEVQAQSVVAQDDPFAIEGDPKGYRRAVFPEAAQAAGVKFVAPPVVPVSG